VYLDGESDTLGGRVTEALGHVPRVGEAAEVEGVRLEVESVEHHAVTSVVATPRRDEASGNGRGGGGRG
jgi:CBS domain containing-hemolysin-like protein